MKAEMIVPMQAQALVVLLVAFPTRTVQINPNLTTMEGITDPNLTINSNPRGSPHRTSKVSFNLFSLINLYRLCITSMKVMSFLARLLNCQGLSDICRHPVQQQSTHQNTSNTTYEF